MIQTILIANRGEIACRVIHTCKRLGIRTAAVYSDADTQALHVQLAAEAVYIGPAPAAESYLAIDNIIKAAQRTGANAIHPGFGFLAENPAFARACAEAGLIFIGPRPEVIEAMGNKRAAKLLMQEAGVPTIPGYDGVEQSNQALLAASEQIGFPLMVKAAAGGGGKGMRVVHEPEVLPEALAAARRESLQAFGSNELMLERLIPNPRHIEFQIFGDTHGNLIHLGERECSIQRRCQKVIEETPSPALTPELREKMGAVAVAAGRAVNYNNAGTVEFMLDEGGSFYFLEINARIQVEHPVTEMVTGLDLVEWQIRVAEGEPLPLTQADVTLNGHAIEARVYAENPANEFLPVTGDILLWRPPSGEGVRVDSGIMPQDSISIYYDPMIGKVIAHGPDRKTALRQLGRALETTTLLGLVNNIAFLRDIIRHPAFQTGKFGTRFLEKHFVNWKQPGGDITLPLIAATVARFNAHPQVESNAGYWRNSINQPILYRFTGQPGICLTPTANGYAVTIDNQTYTVQLNKSGDNDLILTVDGHRRRVILAHTGADWWVQIGASTVHLVEESLLPEPQLSAGAGGSLRAPMPGAIIEALVEVGQTVKKGQALVKLEAMKMEHTIRAAADGVVEAIYFAPGDTVDADAQLLKISETGD